MARVTGGLLTPTCHDNLSLYATPVVQGCAITPQYQVQDWQPSAMLKVKLFLQLNRCN